MKKLIATVMCLGSLNVYGESPVKLGISSGTGTDVLIGNYNLFLPSVEQNGMYRYGGGFSGLRVIGG